MPRVAVTTLKQSPYGFVGQERVDPTQQGVKTAYEEGRFCKNIMDKDYKSISQAIMQKTQDLSEMNRLMREFHNERVAELVRTKDSWLGVLDAWPIKINQFNQIIEGNHRFRAIRFLELDEIEVEVVEEAAPRPEFALPEIW
jgi:hypothetical protein